MLCAVSPLLKSVAKPSLRGGTPVLSNPGLSALVELYLFTKKHLVDGAREVRAQTSANASPSEVLLSFLSLP